MEIIWIVIAYIFGLRSSYIGFPPLVGYLVGGFILGEWGISAGPIIHTIMDVGVLLLLFSIGLKINFTSLLNLEVLSIEVSPI